MAIAQRAMGTCLIASVTGAILGQLGSASLSAGFGDRDILVNLVIGFPSLIDDLFRSETLLTVCPPFYSCGLAL